MNHLDNLVHDWGWWNRAYSRLLIRARGYSLVSMAKELPSVDHISDLPKQESGAIYWLPPRKSFDDLKPPKVALGEHADYVVDYYKQEFAPREDRPFIAHFRNPILYSRQFSILDSRRRAFEECFTRDRRWREGVPKRKPTPKKVPRTYLLAGAEFHNHYAHLFCDVLPRLKIFEDAGLSGKVPCILPPPSHSFAEEAWQKMGNLGNDSLCWDDGCWQLDGLYFASPYKKFCSWTPDAAGWMRQTFKPGLDQQKIGSKIFYISRRSAVRPVLNEEAILAALKLWGVTVVEPDRMPLGEQINLFADAAMIIGPQGAGIQNALWAPRGCKVLEFISPRFFSGVYWTLTESIGQVYGLVTGENPAGEDPTKAGSTFNPKLINRAVEALAL